MKFILSFLFVVVNLFATTPLFTLTSPLADKANVFTSEQKVELEQKLLSIKDKQIAVVTLQNLDGYSLEDYSIQFATLNKLGEKDKDNGLLLLLVMDTQEVRLEVGYGLEGVITDAKAKRLISKYIIPYFKEKEYFKGVFMLLETLQQTEAVTGFETNKTEKNIFELFLTPLLILPLLVGLYFTYKSTQSFLNYKLPKEKHTYVIIALFCSFIVVYILLAYQNDYLDSEKEYIFGTFVMLSFVLPLLFDYFLPLLALIFLGEVEKIKFVRLLTRLVKRENKISKVLGEFSRSKGDLDKYKNNAVLKQHYDKLHEFSFFSPKETYLTCKDNGAIFLANIARNENVTYEYIELCYQDEGEPQISLLITNQDTLLKTIVFSTLEELSEYLKQTNIYWSVISSITFKSKESSSGSSSSSNSGFRGRGGGFGGGGASGKW